MQVLLLKDVKGVGRSMELRTVSDGYAKNFLIPRGFAIPADATAAKLKERHDSDERRLEEKIWNELRELENRIFSFRVKTGPSGEVFGSVSSSHISSALAAAGIHDAEVKLTKPIRTLGEHTVNVALPRGKTGFVKISVQGEP